MLSVCPLPGPSVTPWVPQTPGVCAGISIFGKKNEVCLSSLAASLLPSLYACFVLFSLGPALRNRGTGCGIPQGWNWFCAEERHFERGQFLLSFLPKMGVTRKRQCTAARPGCSCCRHHIGPKHLDTMCGWIPNKPNFPEGSLSMRVARASSQSALVLGYSQQLGYPDAVRGAGA